MEKKPDETKSTPPPTDEKKKITAKDIYTPTGTRQDILNEFSRLMKEIEVNKQTGKRKFNEFIQKKELQATKALEPALEKDSGPEMPIDGDYMNGSRVFMRNCATCHSLEANNQGRNSVMGPALGLIYGKKAGSDKYFNYSDSYVYSQKHFTERYLFQYLANPKVEYHDTKCLIKGGEGLKDEGERADVSKFLRLFSKNLRINLANKAKKNMGNDFFENQSRAQTKLQETQYRHMKESRDF